jgi:hypothetical protein
MLRPFLPPPSLYFATHSSLSAYESDFMGRGLSDLSELLEKRPSRGRSFHSITKLKPSLRKRRIEMRLRRMPMELDLFDSSFVEAKMQSEMVGVQQPELLR